jgi:hypothetical protein
MNAPCQLDRRSQRRATLPEERHRVPEVGTAAHALGGQVAPAQLLAARVVEQTGALFEQDGAPLFVLRSARRAGHEHAAQKLPRLARAHVPFHLV